MPKTPEEVAREALGLGRMSRMSMDTSWQDDMDRVADAIAAERAVIETCVAALKTLRPNYRNDSEHARLIDAALKIAEDR